MRLTKEQIEKMYSSNRSPEVFYGDVPSYYLNRTEYDKLIKEYDEAKHKLDSYLLPEDKEGFKTFEQVEIHSLSEAYDAFPEEKWWGYIIKFPRYALNTELQSLIGDLNSMRTLINIEGVNAYIAAAYGNDVVAKYNAYRGEVMIANENVIYGNISIHYGCKTYPYSLTVFNNYMMGRDTSLLLWKNNGSGIKAFSINRDPAAISSPVVHIDKETALKIIHSIDNNDEYGTALQMLKDAALKIIENRK